MSGFSWSSLFKSTQELSESELPDIFPLSLTQTDFTKSDIVATYVKILTDTIERVHGLPEKFHQTFWDNCVQSEAPEGLVHMLALAMAEKKDLFLVYSASSNVLRRATFDEQREIESDYKAKGESAVGVFVSFKKYRRTDMLLIYSVLEYCILASLNKTVNISKAVQVKINTLRSSVSAIDSSVAVAQAKSIANALKKGNDVLLDAGDDITTSTPETAPTEKAIAFLDSKKAFILGLPMAYIAGEGKPGMGDSGSADTKAIDRGLKQYFVSIIKPVIKALFKVDVEFKSQDFSQVNTALETLKTFELTSDLYLSAEAKTEVIQRMFEVDPNDEKKAKKREASQAAIEPQVQNPGSPQDPQAGNQNRR